MKYLTYTLTLLLFLTDAQALQLSIRQGGDGGARVIAVSNSEVTSTSRSRSSLRLSSSRRAKLALVKDGAPQPVILGYRKGQRNISARTVMRNPQRYCSSGNTMAYTAVSGRRVSLRLSAREQGDVALYRGSLARSRNRRRNRRRLTQRNLSGLVSVNTSTCLPSGNGLTLGLGSSQSEADRAGRSTNRSRSADTLLQVSAPDEESLNSIDRDKDGLADIYDVDVDGDGILNNFDPNFEVLDTSFFLFSNLKISLEDTVNVNTGVTPTDEEIDEIVNTMTLAIEVKGEANLSEVSELDCGDLSYCREGGTGENINDFSSPTAFPGSRGGENDPDSDGLGNIVRGDTGDFQLRANADAADIGGGDTLVQLVTDSDGNETEYVTSLQFTFNTTPALKTIVLNPDSGSPVTTNFSYPVSNSSPGTQGDCLDVTPDGDDNIILDITAWRPQRKGIASLGEADFVDVGNARISIEIPNSPSASLVGGSPSQGPGMCPIESYTTSDDFLTADGDSLQDSLGDRDADATQTVQFRINITSCLASASQTLDSGEKVLLGLQFRNDVGDNAAQNFCIERP